MFLSLTKTTLIRTNVAAALIASIALSGCIQYKHPPLMVKVPNFYENQVVFQRLSLVADPYIESGKMEHVFNTNLLEKGFLAVQFIAFNDSEKTFDLSQSNIALLREDGVLLPPVPPRQVSKKVLHHTSLRMLGWGFAGLIILSIPLSLAAGVDSRRANQGIRRTLKENILKSSEIGPHEIISGFYFFKIGKSFGVGEGSLARQYRFRIDGLREIDSGQEYEFNIGIN